MEGKTVIVSVLIMTLVMAKVQVEAVICCTSKDTRNVFNICRYAGGSQSTCLGVSGCQDFSGSCPPGYPNDILENSGDTINEYCKLGCAFSMCGSMITLQNSDANEIVNEAVDQCTKACSGLCKKGPLTTVKSA